MRCKGNHHLETCVPEGGRPTEASLMMKLNKDEHEGKNASDLFDVPYREDRTPTIEYEMGNQVLVCRDGTLHWLTKMERINLRFGFTNIHKLDQAYCKLPQQG